MPVILLFCTVSGLLIGSFLNVVIWRVPRGESIVRPPSACPQCAAPIRPRDNVPVLGWLILKGRCRDCGSPISPRYPLIEAATGVVFLILALRLGADPALPAYLYLGGLGIALAMIDVDTRRLPDVLVLPSYAVGAGLLALGLLGAHHDLFDLARAVSGAAALFAFYRAIVFVYPKGMGFGDVKLAGVIGLYTAYLGWGAWCVGAFAGFLLGGLWGIAVVARGKGGRKTAIPYGPFMLAGALVAVVWGQSLAHGYLNATVH